MTNGYQMLESGQLKQAVDFFQEVLEDYPENKTANICLGRAVGLSGNPSRALQIFAKANELYPNDFELGLNIAEAYLWNNLPKQSLEVYTSLLIENSENYTANLGTANCYYELQDYENALLYIENAISIQPNNLDTYNSKKYILLAFAAKKTDEFDYRSAIDYLNVILEFKPLDTHALLNKGINFIKLENYKLAENSFQTLIDHNLELVESNILLSHLSMLKHKNKDAILYSERAIEAADLETEAQFLRANIQRINALGAAKKFKIADKLLSDLQDEFGDLAVISMARARLKVWNRDANLGLDIYEELERSYDVCMGEAEAHIAMFNRSEALDLLDEALTFNPYSHDALRLKQELINKKRASVEVGVNISNDDGGNEANEVYARLNKPMGDQHLLHLFVGSRNAYNNSINTGAKQIQLFVGDRIRFNRKWILNTAMGLSTTFNQGPLNTVAMGDLNYQINKNHSLNVGYNRESLRYSSDLIKSGLISNKLSAIYQFGSPKKPGLVVQYYKSIYNDANMNDGFLASLYYEISSFPLLKVGANATYISFNEQKPLEYFSPEKYKMAEVFLQAGNIYDDKAKFTYSVMVAVGKQQIENNQIETAQRIDIQLGYQFKSKVSVSVNYFTNSAANANLKAYSFQRFGLKLIKTL